MTPNSGDDIRRQRILDMRDAVLEEQLALLEPLNLQPVAGANPLQRLDRRIQISMLLLQTGKLCTQCAVGVIVLIYPACPPLKPLPGRLNRPFTRSIAVAGNFIKSPRSRPPDAPDPKARIDSA